MGVMRRTLDSNSAVITFSSGGDKKDSRSWCPSCSKVGINSPLKHRIYLDKQGNITAPESDAKQWRQCHKCGNIVPVYEAKVEADIETLTEPTTNPFNNHSRDNSSEGSEQNDDNDAEYDNRLNTHRKKKHKQDIEQYKEQDIKDALRKGGKLISYTEY